MGVVGSKSHLERRNSVLRRSQRKSVHGAKSKAEKLVKDIKKFKGIEEDTDYEALKGRIGSIEKELKVQTKNLQPQIRAIYSEALKKTQDCYQLLEDKLRENQDKFEEAEAKKALQNNPDPVEHKEEEVDDDVFIQEILDEPNSTNKRQTVELTLVQVEPIESSPQINKRFSAMKIGVPVMPGSMMEAIHRKTEDSNTKLEGRVAQIRKSLENLEEEISQFVGKKGGKYYNKIKEQLEEFGNELSQFSSTDDEIAEEIKLCRQLVGSCVSFLDERAVDGVESDDDDHDYDEVTEMTQPTKNPNVLDSNLSPRSIRTTYI